MFLVLKDLDQSQELETTAKKSLQFTCSAHRISVLLRLRRDFVRKKLSKKKGINKHAALRSFRKI